MNLILITVTAAHFRGSLTKYFNWAEGEYLTRRSGYYGKQSWLHRALMCGVRATKPQYLRLRIKSLLPTDW